MAVECVFVLDLFRLVLSLFVPLPPFSSLIRHYLAQLRTSFLLLLLYLVECRRIHVEFKVRRLNFGWDLFNGVEVERFDLVGGGAEGSTDVFEVDSLVMFLLLSHSHRLSCLRVERLRLP